MGSSPFSFLKVEVNQFETKVEGKWTFFCRKMSKTERDWSNLGSSCFNLTNSGRSSKWNEGKASLKEKTLIKRSNDFVLSSFFASKLFLPHLKILRFWRKIVNLINRFFLLKMTYFVIDNISAIKLAIVARTIDWMDLVHALSVRLTHAHLFSLSLTCTQITHTHSHTHINIDLHTHTRKHSLAHNNRFL